ncbi:MAG: BamA/TamA family outer membrane protein [Candidatus Cryptobacteroides sp.]
MRQRHIQRRFLRAALRVSCCALCFVALSCSTTRSLADGEYRLASNKVIVTNDRKYDVKDIQPYIKQKSNSYLIFGWNPFLNIYNWSGQNGEKGFGKFFRKIGVAPVVYDPASVGTSVENIERHLEYQGYYGSKVESFARIEGKKVDVFYNVTLGKRIRISDIEFDLPEGSIREDFLPDTTNLGIRKGDWLSESSLEAESERVAAALRQKGYFGFTKHYLAFEADTLGSETAKLKMSIREYTRNQTAESARPHTRYSIGDVSIAYDEDIRFREKVLREICTIRPGDLYDERDVNNTYSRLSALRLFNGVNIEMTPGDSSVVDCNINLSGSKRQGFKADFEASTNSNGLIGVSPQLSYFHKNIFHGGEWMNLSFLGNFQFKFKDRNIRSNEFGVSSSISLPEFLGLPRSLFKGADLPRTEIGASYNFQSRPEYTRHMISMNYGYTGNSLGGHMMYQAYPLRVKLVKLSNLDSDFASNLAANPFIMEAYQNHIDEGAGVMLWYSSSTDLNPKVSHYSAKFQIDASGNLMSLFNPLMKQNESGQHTIWDVPYSQYVRSELSFAKTLMFSGRNHSLAMRVLAGAGFAYGNSARMPFEKQFYSGGSNSMRGWQARALGPGNSAMNPLFVIPSQTGDVKLEANLEYRFPLFWRLGGALFTDVGNVWTLKSGNGGDENLKTDFSFSNLGKTIAANWGLGIRLDLNFLILRIDTGIKIYEPSRENPWVSPKLWTKNDSFAIHFGVGYPF